MRASDVHENLPPIARARELLGEYKASSKPQPDTKPPISARSPRPTWKPKDPPRHANNKPPLDSSKDYLQAELARVAWDNCRTALRVLANASTPAEPSPPPSAPKPSPPGSEHDRALALPAVRLAQVDQRHL